ncbi:hypothetical protein ACN4EE_06785 [Geminocystis sp. CENA526]|uniref:hypothetical protein n=1 Tax=Geminocystis sp. CENA526 TaxID=1355871 RepID=UPI003D6EC5A9
MTYKIEALVEQVINSSSNLTERENITIYMNYPQQISNSPTNIPAPGTPINNFSIINEGEVLSAYLRRVPPYSPSEKVYTTAIGVNSFNHCHRWNNLKTD